MQQIVKKWGSHLAAIFLFLVLALTYFAPIAFEGKVLRQGDNEKFVGIAKELDDLRGHENNDIIAWQGNMFSGMPSYHSTVLGLPENHLNVFGKILSAVDYSAIRMVLIGLICFYILMCVMGVNKWLAIAGAIAYAFASYNIIIIEAGHITKAYVIAYMPLTLAGMALLFKNRWLWGFVVFTLGVAMSIVENHLQITFYLILLCALIYIGFVVKKIKSKDYPNLIKASLLMLLAVCLAVLPNLSNLYGNWEMSKNSIRGKSELTQLANATGQIEKVSGGLDKDYAFQWSYGWKELLTVLVPNTYGGSSGGKLDSSSELYKELKRNGAQVGKDVQTYTYWGDKPFTSGPVYFGALVCFLFVLGMFVIKNPMKWWLFAGSVFLTFLALGRNFDAFNDLMFHYLPLYNKFRTVEMALVIPGLVVPIIGFWGLNEILKQRVDERLMKKGFSWALGLTGGICVILWLMPSLLLNFQSVYDSQFQGKVPEWYYSALLLDRASLASADALRSLTFIVLGALLLVWFWLSKDKTKTANYVGIGVIILVLVDLWTVDRRYLNDSNYTKEQPASFYKESVADAAILKDKDLSYRVFNLNNPWQETNTAFFHKSIGGYHAAKLRRYQELIDHRLDKEYASFVNALQQAKSADDVLDVLADSHSLNMLNTRYIIYNPDQAPVYNPYAYGNAWFVDELEIVPDADAEIAALNTISPWKTAVVDKRFEKDLQGFVPALDSTATIQLESYRPNKLTYKTKTSSEQLAVFSEIYYQPGWVSYIDGKEVPHFRTDWILRGMLVPAGEHTIVFEFKPQAYITAAYISSYSSLLILLLLLAAAGWSIWSFYKKKERKE